MQADFFQIYKPTTPLDNNNLNRYYHDKEIGGDLIMAERQATGEGQKNTDVVLEALIESRNPEGLRQLMKKRGTKGTERNNLIGRHLRAEAQRLMAVGEKENAASWANLAQRVEDLGEEELTPGKVISLVFSN